MTEIQNRIYGFITSLDNEVKSDYIRFEYNIGLEQYLTETNIEFEKIRSEDINVYFSNLSFIIYSSTNSYLKEANISKKNDLLIVDYNGVPLSRINSNIYLNFKIKDNFYFFSNSNYYLEFISFLKSKQEESDDGFHFIDYSNSVERKIVITSLAEKSRIILKYFKEVPNFSNEFDYSTGYNQFKSCFEEVNQTLPKFLKNSLMRYASRYQSEERSKLVFQNLKDIVNDARMTFEIYINNLSIDSIRKEYDTYKSKYFNEVSDILKKITQQIIGFPIVVSATLFAIEKVKENNIFLMGLIAVVFVTTILLILLLNLNFKDLGYVEHLSNKDFDSIKGNNFFIKYPEEFETFKKIKGRITTRIKNLIFLCESYFWILSLSNTGIICLILHYLNVNVSMIVMYSLISLLLMGITRNKIWQEHTF